MDETTPLPTDEEPIWHVNPVGDGIALIERPPLKDGDPVYEWTVDVLKPE